LKPPGFTTLERKVKNWFHRICSFKWVNLYRYTEAVANLDVPTLVATVKETELELSCDIWRAVDAAAAAVAEWEATFASDAMESARLAAAAAAVGLYKLNPVVTHSARKRLVSSLAPRK
jgi:hypothetical protein